MLEKLGTRDTRLGSCKAPVQYIMLLSYILIFPEVTINRLREKVREYEDKIEDTAKVCGVFFDKLNCSKLDKVKR